MITNKNGNSIDIEAFIKNNKGGVGVSLLKSVFKPLLKNKKSLFLIVYIVLSVIFTTIFLIINLINFIWV